MTLEERTFRALLRLYPRRFRHAYAEDMTQLFRDQLRDARGANRPGAVAMTWFRTLGDLVQTAIGERARSGIAVGHSLDGPSLPTLRALGLIGVVGGLGLVAVFVVDLGPMLGAVRLPLYSTGAIAIILGMVAAGLARTSRGVAVALIAAGLANAGVLATTLGSVGRPVFPEPDPDFRLLSDYVMAAMWLSDAALGLALIRLRSIARTGALALAVGSPLAFLGMSRLELVSDAVYGAVIQSVALAGIGLNGLGWILLGAALVLAHRAEASAQIGLNDSND
jgi:hypothetical protein